MTILAGDLGGTKTLLALCDDDGQRLVSQRFASAAYPDFESLVAAFLAAHSSYPSPRRFALGVAGPVIDVGSHQTCDITNLPYRVSGAALAQRFGFASVRLINDFYAVALAIAQVAQGTSLPGLTLTPLNPAAQPIPRAPIAVLGAGTGLGEALIAFHGDQPVILPTEGGHSDFAPHDEEELALWRFLSQRFPDHISQERVVCGPGIVTLYEFFCQQAQTPHSPQIQAEIARASDPAQVISAHAMHKSDPLCQRVMQRFVMLYGAEAGNLALKSLARGGVYLAGGIAAKILPLLTDGLFLSHFANKGRFAALLRSIPVYVVDCAEIGLFGAMACARQLPL